MNVCPRCQRPIPDGIDCCLVCAEAATPASLRACPNCGEAVSATTDYCPQCGQGLRPSLVKPCPSCGAPNRRETLFCRRCGQPTTPAEPSDLCPQCQRQVRPGAQFCEACGAPQANLVGLLCLRCGNELPANSLFCPACGAPFAPPPDPDPPPSIPPPRDRKPTSALRWPLVIAILLCLITVALFYALLYQPPPATAPTIITSAMTAKGLIQVGATAYIDGRNLDARQPATRMYLPVWDQLPGRQVVCAPQHGAPALVKEIRWVEEEHRYYFQIEAENCHGWIAEPSLSSQPHAVAGQQL